MTNTMNQEQIKTDRLTISYLVGGVPDGIPLFLLHGNVSSNIFWEDTVRELIKTYRVFAGFIIFNCPESATVRG